MAIKTILKERAQKIRRDIPAVFLALHKKETPLIAKLFAALTVAYALSPIDLIPDFIPVLGYLDDILLLPAFITLTIDNIPKDILEQCRVDAQNLWLDGKPVKWIYAIPILIIWGGIIWWVISILM